MPGSGCILGKRTLKAGSCCCFEQMHAVLVARSEPGSGMAAQLASLTPGVQPCRRALTFGIASGVCQKGCDGLLYSARPCAMR
jgi:hypothetical protein